VRFFVRRFTSDHEVKSAQVVFRFEMVWGVLGYTDRLYCCWRVEYPLLIRLCFV
jgi:hypothetical protein